MHRGPTHKKKDPQPSRKISRVFIQIVYRKENASDSERRAEMFTSLMITEVGINSKLEAIFPLLDWQISESLMTYL
jgi:hypothetical protein